MSLAKKDFEVKTAFFATAVFGVLLSFEVFLVHKRCLNKYKLHTSEFYILCSAEAHFLKWPGEKRRICCLQIRIFSPHMVTEGEIKVVMATNKVSGVILILQFLLQWKF